MLCIGDPSTAKSTFLNNVFGLDFEVIQENAIGLFHDSVDCIFNSKSIPIGLNIFDFQGYANLDLSLITNLLEKMPRSLLFLQVSSVDYLETIVGSFTSELRKILT